MSNKGGDLYLFFIYICSLTFFVNKMNKAADKKKRNRHGVKGHGSIPAFLLKTYEILEVLFPCP